MAEPLPRDLRLTGVGAAIACALPMLLQLPRPLAALLVATLAIGLFSRYRWPAWLRLVLTLALGGVVMTSFGFRIGRDTASALLVAMLALKSFELDAPRDVRSLVGFSLFAPFAAFLQDQGPLTLLLALPATLAVLLALARLAEAVPTVREPVLPSRQRLRGAGVALLLALPLAAVSFWLFPRLATPLWGMPGNAAAKTGLNDRMAPGDWLEVANDDTPAFRVRFLTPPPRPDQMYWRGPVLGQFDGRAWTRSGWTAALPPPPVVAAGPEIRYDITLEPTERNFLFALDLPASISVPARMGLDLTLTTRREVVNVLRYQATSVPPASFEPELRQTLRRAMVGLPEGFNPRTLALARRWRAEGADDDAVVRRALEWINSDFTYSLDTPLLGRNSVDEFLFDTRIGFCEHFSSAFVVLMRSAGIPARVVTGYAGGAYNPLGGYFLVRQSDAHAWTEVWLAGRGWVRVDPTAAVAPERVFKSSGEQLESGALAAIRQVGAIGDWARITWSDLLLQFDAARQRALLRPLGIAEANNVQLGTAFTLGAALALALTLWLLLRDRGRPRDPVLRAWSAFQARLARIGLAKAAHEPALSYGRRVAGELPEQAESLLSLSRRFAGWRYAAGELDAAQRRALARELREFRPRSRPARRQGEPA